MIKIFELLLLLLLFILFIKYHKGMIEKFLEFNRNSKYSIIIWISIFILDTFLTYLQIILFKQNLIPKLLYIITSNIRLILIIYTPIIIIAEIIRYKFKNSTNIFKVIVIDMILGEKILFNLLFIITFIGLYQYRYNLKGVKISDGASNIINTIQTIIVTFFITLNFSEGYKKNKEKKLWSQTRNQIFNIYIIISAKFITSIKHKNFYTNLEDNGTIKKLFSQTTKNFIEFKTTQNFSIIQSVFSTYIEELNTLKNIENKLINYDKFNDFNEYITLEIKNIDFILSLIPNYECSREVIKKFINLKTALAKNKTLFVDRKINLLNCQKDNYINEQIINRYINLFNILTTLEF